MSRPLRYSASALAWEREGLGKSPQPGSARGLPLAWERPVVEMLSSPETWMAFATLAVLEIVLGIDNVIFISILTNRLPKAQQRSARLIGLSLAMGTRILLLFSLSWVMGLTDNLFFLLGQGISGRDVILLLGGAFLLAKSTREVHNSLESEPEETRHGGAASGFLSVLAQIAVIDVVFSLDSVITAVGLVNELPVMVAAIVAAVLVMMVAAGPVSKFVEDNPTIKMLALSFLVLIGVTLVAEGLDIHVPKGYIYFAMAFSFGVEVLNIRATKRKRMKRMMLADLMRGEEAAERPAAGERETASK